MRAYVIAPKPIVASAPPSQSNLLLAVSSRLSGTLHSDSRITTTAIGRLIKKTQRHDACATSHPPRTGPMDAVIAVKADHVPIARPRSLSVYEALMIAKLPGTSSAAPIP